jgi:hypothetical protein
MFILTTIAPSNSWEIAAVNLVTEISAGVTSMASMGTKGTKSDGKCRNYRGKRGRG